MADYERGLPWESGYTNPKALLFCLTTEVSTWLITESNTTFYSNMPATIPNSSGDLVINPLDSIVDIGEISTSKEASDTTVTLANFEQDNQLYHHKLLGDDLIGLFKNVRKAFILEVDLTRVTSGDILAALRTNSVTPFINDGTKPVTLLLNGIISNISADEQKISISVSKRPIHIENTSLKRGYYDSNHIIAELRNLPKPICFGKVANISPILIDTATPTYQIHDGEIEAVLEIREGGAVLDPSVYTVDLTNGTFTLNNNPTGQITCDAIGRVLTSYDYGNDALYDIIVDILVHYLDANVSPNIVDVAKLKNNVIGQYIVGTYIGTYEANGGEIIRQFLEPLRASYYMDNTGILTLYVIEQTLTYPLVGSIIGPDGKIYEGAPDSLIVRDENILDYKVRGVVYPKSKVVIDYKKNFTQQDPATLAQSIPESIRNWYAKDWLGSVNKKYTSNGYKNAIEDEVQKTLIYEVADATTEVDNRYDLLVASDNIIEEFTIANIFPYPDTAQEFLALGSFVHVDYRNTTYGGILISHSYDPMTGIRKLEVHRQK